MRRKCFSLVEMLTVIAIISILAGMIMPVLNYSRSISHRTECINNKANVIRAMFIYADKNDGVMPFMIDGKSYAYALIGKNYKQIPGAKRPDSWAYDDAYLQPATLTCTVANIVYNDGDESTTNKINNAFGMLNVAEDVTSWKGKWKNTDDTYFNHFGRFLTATENDSDIGYAMGRMKNPNTLPILADSFKQATDTSVKIVPIWNFYLYGDAGSTGEVGMPGMVHSGQTTVAYADGSCRSVGARVLSFESGLRYTLTASLDKRMTNGVRDN